jgi:hypothetical protein
VQPVEQHLPVASWQHLPVASWRKGLNLEEGQRQGEDGIAQ